MSLNYLSRINENYRGIFHHGYSRITNDIRRCDRLSNIEYRMLEELLNIANIKKKDIVSIEKWKLQKMLNVQGRRIEQVARTLMAKGFLKEMESDGKRYEFILEDDIEMNPLVVLSEVEYDVLSSLRPKTKKDSLLMLKLVQQLGNKNQNELINSYLSGSFEENRKNYHSFLVNYLTKNGVNFKSDKTLKAARHEQEVQRYLREHEEKLRIEEENSEPGVIDMSKYGKKMPF